MKKDKKFWSIIINVLIIIFEIIGLICNYNYYGRISIEYYTIDSNILALISSLLFLLFTLLEKKISNFVRILKYTSTLCLSVTFLVVLLILIPMANFDFYGLLFRSAMPYHHLLCPILSLISFLYFDDLGEFTIKDSVMSLGVTIIYSIVTIVLNLNGSLVGPYPFLEIKNNSIISSIMWFIIIYSITYLLSFTLRKLRYKINVGVNK